MSEAQQMTVAELLATIDKGWNAFNTYLSTLTPEQLTTPTDAAGWTAKDHIMHLAEWENSMLAMLNKEDRAAAMGIDATTWTKAMTEGSFDAINSVMQQRNKNKTVTEVQDASAKAHQHLMDKVDSLTDEDLQRPYNYFQPKSNRDVLVINWLYSNTVEHYDEHQSYIERIIGDKMSKAELLEKINKGWVKRTYAVYSNVRYRTADVKFNCTSALTPSSSTGICLISHHLTLKVSFRGF